LIEHTVAPIRHQRTHSHARCRARICAARYLRHEHGELQPRHCSRPTVVSSATLPGWTHRGEHPAMCLSPANINSMFSLLSRWACTHSGLRAFWNASRAGDDTLGDASLVVSVRALHAWLFWFGTCSTYTRSSGSPCSLETSTDPRAHRHHRSKPAVPARRLACCGRETTSPQELHSLDIHEKPFVAISRSHLRRRAHSASCARKTPT